MAGKANGEKWVERSGWAIGTGNDKVHVSLS